MPREVFLSAAGSFLFPFFRPLTCLHRLARLSAPPSAEAQESAPILRARSLLLRKWRIHWPAWKFALPHFRTGERFHTDRAIRPEAEQDRTDMRAKSRYCPGAPCPVLIVQQTAESRLRIVRRRFADDGGQGVHPLATNRDQGADRRALSPARRDDPGRVRTFASPPPRRRPTADGAGAGDEEESGLSSLGPFAECRSDHKSLMSLSRVSKEWRDIALEILLRVKLVPSRAQGMLQEISH